MPYFLTLFLTIVLTLSIIVFGIGEIASSRGEVDIDSQYYNSDGDHIYYERSLIEKKEFQKRFPHISIRKLSGLFRRTHSGK